jgi:hypothetical protein
MLMLRRRGQNLRYSQKQRSTAEQRETRALSIHWHISRVYRDRRVC